MNSNHGGAREGAGGLVTRPPLSKEAARTLRLLVKARNLKYGAETAARVLEGLIEQAWQELDEQYQRHADKEQGNERQ